GIGGVFTPLHGCRKVTWSFNAVVKIALRHPRVLTDIQISLLASSLAQIREVALVYLNGNFSFASRGSRVQIPVARHQSLVPIPGNLPTDQPVRTAHLGVCQPRQQAALRPAAANGLGAQSRPVEHRQTDDAVARGTAIAKGRYRRRDADPLR